MFDPLIQDLKQLMEQGLEFNGKIYKVALWQVIGDNLALNKLFGFVESSSANYCCRFCLVHKSAMHNMTRENVSLLRRKDVHEGHVATALDGNIEYGVKGDRHLNDLGYWHVTNNLTFDVVHDLFEGWCATETLLILNHVIFLFSSRNISLYLS